MAQPLLISPLAIRHVTIFAYNAQAAVPVVLIQYHDAYEMRSQHKLKPSVVYVRDD